MLKDNLKKNSAPTNNLKKADCLSCLDLYRENKSTNIEQFKATMREGQSKIKFIASFLLTLKLIPLLIFNLIQAMRIEAEADKNL
jgi:hypothetical protein